MITGKSSMNKKSLATGAPLDAETFADFKARLRYDRVGNGVNAHFTAKAVFDVQEKYLVVWLDGNDSEGNAVVFDGGVWTSPADYWNQAEEGARDELTEIAKTEFYGEAGFLFLDECDQWIALSKMKDHIVTHYKYEWRHVSSHMTNDAAKAFVGRKKHDYQELRVCVNSGYYSWEMNTLIDAFLDGSLGFIKNTT